MASDLGELHDGTDLLNDRTALCRFLDEHGYLLVRGVLDRALIDRLRRALIGALRRQGAPGTDGLDESFLRSENDVDWHQLSQEFSCKELWDDSASMRLFETVFGRPVHLPKPEIVRYLPAGADDYLLPPHQDRHFLEEEFMTVWVPLDRIEADGGALGIADGSYRRGYLPHHDITRTSYHNGRPYPGVSESAVTEEWLTAAFEPGDALFFLPCTIHKTLPNRASDGRTRLSADNRIFAR